MIETLPFQTRARTIDHLGREQIADCPTAISELWKNAYDAYAKKVELHVFDGEVPVAAIVDDGHGMNREEFVEKWLVVGTESKATNNRTNKEDRMGLPERVRQGQKGIGRLSCANIAPLLLLVSKRKNDKFVASLLDWRLFENPYLILSDIKIPVVEFDKCHDIIGLIPELFDQLLVNLWGEKPSKGDGDLQKAAKDEHRARVGAAWASYDEYMKQGRMADNDLTDEEKAAPLPSAEIESTLVSTLFEERHFSVWPVWDETSDCGTILMMANLNFDLLAQLNVTIDDTAVKETKAKFFETLSSFVDPCWAQSRLSSFSEGVPIQYGAYKWNGNKKDIILGTTNNFTITDVEEMEHVVEGRINHEGTFQGRIKAFGKWHDDVAIPPPSDLIIPHGPSTKLGPIDVYLTAVEFQQKNTTHEKGTYAHYKELAQLYSGLMIHRDGLRVLPFGRTDVDFFDIEKRRSLSAGREFWNARQMFGRLGVSRKFNPNLTDKAGREGLLDNRAAKTFKAIGINLLKTVARVYFGSASDIRKKILPELQETYKEKKAEDDRVKLRTKRRKQFRNNLKHFAPEIAALRERAIKSISNFDVSDENTIDQAQKILDEINNDYKKFVLGDVPKNLSDSYQQQYDEFSEDKKSIHALVRETQTSLNKALQLASEKSPAEHAAKKIKSQKAILEHSSRQYRDQIGALQKSEFERIGKLILERKELFEERIKPIVVKLESEDIELYEALSLFEEIRTSIEVENADLFEPYIRALECMEESIDLEVLATFGMEQVSDLSAEISRLNSLAQLGIAIEIIGHELQSFDDLIGAGLRELPDKIKNTDPYVSIQLGYEGLTNQLRFLSPLKLAGTKKECWVTGEELYEYVKKFFGQSFVKNDISFDATEAFKKFSVFDQPSRLYPVFINLVNNSRYWLAHKKSKERNILLDIKDSQVIISDNGPGVDKLDIDNLFTLFFTKKLKGGRGVGLYLSRANLTAGGHRIAYVKDNEQCPMQGANFAITFKGGKYV